jgi:hypothetical protein
VFIPLITSILTTHNPHKQTRKIISNGKNYNFHRKEFRRKKESVGLATPSISTTRRVTVKMELRKFLNLNILTSFRLQ